MSRRILYLLALLLLVTQLVGCGSQQASQETEQVKIGITQIVKHSSLDAVKDGFKDQLQEQGYEEGENISYDFQNAQGDMSTAQTIATNFAQDDLDAVLAIATPSAQAVANAINETPILISAVTDPKEAGLVDSYQEPGGNLTGTSDLTPVGKQLDLFNKLNQDINQVGIIYNSGESNSTFLAELAQEKAKELDLELVEATVTSSSEVYQAAQSLTGRVDGIYVPTDNTVVSAIQSVIKVANQNDLPLITGESNSVESGALATLGVDYYQLGSQTGKMAVKVLEEEKTPSELPIEYAKETKLVINRQAATEMNVDLPEELVNQAAEVIK
ncbi:ABC transporter substrate-binding protein [Halanaerobaculum tunisiense]